MIFALELRAAYDGCHVHWFEAWIERESLNKSLALSLDFRERVATAIDAGASRRQVAGHFGVGMASAMR